MLSSIISRAVWITSFLQFLSVAAVSTVSNLDGLIPAGYGIEEIVWEIQASPGGPTVNVTGTVQDVIRYAEKVNPNFRSDFALDHPSEVSSRDGHLYRRYEFLADNCDMAVPANLDAIKEGIRYLRGIFGHPAMGPGPGNCGKVSCSKTSAIVWCNDNPSDKGLNRYSDIANAAQMVIDHCQGDSESSIHGQVFFKDLWNVIVGKAKDHC